ncbi:MAG: hypothetical protein KA259_01010, partial [Caldilineaceae bacterium]|nr:hypothetical protein [Caldilineaceae bacterium]
RGSKVFGLGWSKALDSELYTDDDSAYVELHAGLAPTFFEQTKLAAGDSVTWREFWQPLSGIGGVRAANATGALNWTRQDDALQIGFQPARSFVGELVIVDNALVEVERVKVKATPAKPWSTTVSVAGNAGLLHLMLEDSTGSVVLESR